jgi:zinc transport system permease protein
MDAVLPFFQYEFIQRAYLSGGFIAATTAMLGLFLVLRKFSLIGDGLSHVSFGAIALGLFLGWAPFSVAIPVVVLSSYLILLISRKARVYGDAAIGIVSSAGVAAGVLLASLAGGFDVDLMSYLFGNILAVSADEVVFSVALSILVLFSIVFLYHDLFSSSFDEDFARISGISTNAISVLLASLTAVAVVLAIKVVGIMLVSALLVVPPVSALQVARGFRSTLLLSVVLSILSVFIGITASFFADLPAGGTIVMTNIFIFLVLSGWRYIR